MFCSDAMSGSYFIAQTIDATAMTLGQGHGKVIQYIFPDPYILCAKYLRFKLKRFWGERQKLLWRRRTRRKRTENIKSPQTGVT